MPEIRGQRLWGAVLRRAVVLAALLLACATDAAGPPVPVASVEVTPQAAPVQVGATLQLQASTKDAAGSPLNGRSVSWSSNDTAVATVSGTGLVTGRSLGPTTITATSEGHGGTATVTVMPGPAAQLIFTGQPNSVTAGDILTPPVEVTARDVQGNTATGFTGNVTVAIVANPGGGTLSGTTSVAAVAGVVRFTNLSINKSDAGYTLVATSGSLTSAASSAFTVTASTISASQSTASSSPATITASTGSSAATITVTAKDGFGNPIQGATVVLAATGTGNTLTQPSGTTNGSGVATGTLSSTDAGAKVVSITINSIAIAQTATVTVNPAGVSAAQSTVSAAPTTITASPGSSAATITVTAKDAFGNPIQGATVVLAATGTGNTLTQPSGTTNASGVATGTLSSTDPGAKVVSATISGVAITQTATVTVNPAGVSAAQSTVSAAPTTITASTGSSASTITVTARDAFGNPIQGATVVLAATGPGNTLTQPSGTTSASGVATGTLSSTGTGPKVVSATINAVTITQTAAVTVNPAGVSAAQSTVSAAPTTITASTGSSASTITVTARDGFGNPIQGATVVLAATGTGNTLSQPSGTTNASGVATGTLSSTDPGAKVVSATISGVATTQTATVTVNPAGVSAAQSTVSAAPTTITASSGSSAATITVTAKDAFGNPIQGATVVLAATGPGNTLTQPSGTTNASGVATGTLSSTGAGTKVVSATIGGVAITQTASVTVNVAGVSAAQSTVSAAPTTITASTGSSASTITVTAKDASGNLIQGATVVLAATGSGNTLTQPSATTNASGVATGMLSSTDAEAKVVSATINSIAIIQTATVTVDPAGVSAAQSTVSSAPTTITASNGSSASTITVTARDGFGNPVLGATVLLAATGTGNTLSQPSGTTNASGVVTGTLSSTDPAVKVVSATINGVAITQTAAVTVDPAGVSAAQSTVNAAPITITASNGSSASTITVTARDGFGNPIQGATVVLAATGSGNTLTQPSGTTNASGVATGTLSSTGAGTKVVSATIGGVAITQTATVTVNPAGVSASQSTVLASPTTITASNGSSASTITVTAKDAFGNFIQGATVVLAATGTGNTLTQPSGTTSASGVATGTLSSTSMGAKVVSATINGVAITQTATVTVNVAGVSAAQSTVSAAPTTITASTGSSASTITVTAKDAFGNLIQGATVVLAATGTGNTLTQPSGTTNASGVASGTLSSTDPAVKVVSATINGVAITQTAAVTVNPAGVSASQSTVLASPTTITASTGSSAATITVTAKDGFGNPIQGATVVLAATGTGNTLTQPSGTTSASGVATGTLSSTGAGTKVVSATIGGVAITQTATVTVDVAGVSAAQSTVSAAPTTITASTGSSAATITVTARDAFGNLIQGATVVLAATGTDNTLTQPGSTTNGSGVATGTLSSIEAESKTVSATINGVGVTQTATVTVNPDGVSAAQSTVSAAPATITASNGSSASTITVTAEDAFGNPIQGATVVLAATGTGNTLTQPSGTTNGSGVATGTLSSTGAGPKVVSTTITGVAITQTASVTVNPGSASVLAVTGQPTNTIAGSMINAGSGGVVVTARDAFGNTATAFAGSVLMAIGANPGGGALSGTNPVTAASGVATFSSLSINKTGTGYTLQATSGVLTPAVSIAFNVTPGSVSASQSTVTTSADTIGQCLNPCDPAKNGASIITVTARDQLGNLVPGVAVTLSAAPASADSNRFTNPGAVGTTNPSGVFTANFNSAQALLGKTVSVTAGGTAITQTAAIIVMPVLVGAGDIAECGAKVSDDSTARLLDSIPGTVYSLGDNAYPNGRPQDYANCYDPTWGRHKARTRPVTGNHEYDSSATAAGYLGYFGAAVADPLGNGGYYYSYDLGTWHIVVLNTDIPIAPQVTWLQTDLAGRTNQCILAFWHRPIFTSGSSGGRPSARPLWQALENAGAEIVVNGHDHLYERFALQDSLGNADPTGIREFIVGTGGGETHTNYVNTPPNVEASDNGNFSRGVMRLTLYANSYRWEFIPALGFGTYTDSGTEPCH